MKEESKTFLKNKLVEEYGKELAEKIWQGYNVKRKTTFRINTLKADENEVISSLTEQGFSLQKTAWYDKAYTVLNKGDEDLYKTAEFECGKIYLQSLSSMLPPIVLAPKQNDTILDMAAAPGGKTTEIACLTKDTSPITACEFNSSRAEKLKFNLAKQGVKKANVMVCDARNLSDFFAFDEILLDTPCTGSGTVDLCDEYSKAVFDDRNLNKITSTQTVLIQKALKLLKKGKTMVYSTCSVFKEENEMIVEKALKTGLCELEKIDVSAFEGVNILPTTIDGVLCVMPDENYEGFFVAKLKKK